MKIAYAGFDLFYPVLENLYENGCEIVKIFSCKVDNETEFNTSVSSFAKAHTIPITFEKITIQDLESLKAFGVDALICAGYYYRMPILEGFKMINIHPSLLPVGRGAWPMPISILNKDKLSGVTIHKMDECFDTGDIIMQESFELDANDNLETFMNKVYKTLKPMIEKLINNFEYYYNNAQKQGVGEYWEAPDERDYIITQNTSFEDADKILRAFYGFYTIYDDGEKEHNLLYARAVKGNSVNKKYKVRDGYIVCNKNQ